MDRKEINNMIDRIIDLGPLDAKDDDTLPPLEVLSEEDRRAMGMTDVKLVHSRVERGVPNDDEGFAHNMMNLYTQRGIWTEDLIFYDQSTANDPLFPDFTDGMRKKRATITKNLMDLDVKVKKYAELCKQEEKKEPSKEAELRRQTLLSEFSEEDKKAFEVKWQKAREDVKEREYRMIWPSVKELYKALSSFMPAVVVNLMAEYVVECDKSGNMFEAFDELDFGLRWFANVGEYRVGWCLNRSRTAPFFMDIGRDHSIHLTSAYSDWNGMDVYNKQNKSYCCEQAILSNRPLGPFEVELLQTHIIQKRRLARGMMQWEDGDVTLDGTIEDYIAPEARHYDEKPLLVFSGHFAGHFEGHPILSRMQCGYVEEKRVIGWSTLSVFYGLVYSTAKDVYIDIDMNYGYEGFRFSSSTLTLLHVMPPMDGGYRYTARMQLGEILIRLQDPVIAYRLPSKATWNRTGFEDYQCSFEGQTPVLYARCTHSDPIDALNPLNGLIPVLKRIIKELTVLSHHGKRKLLSLHPTYTIIRKFREVDNYCGFFDICLKSFFDYTRYLSIFTKIDQYLASIHESY